MDNKRLQKVTTFQKQDRLFPLDSLVLDSQFARHLNNDTKLGNLVCLFILKL